MLARPAKRKLVKLARLVCPRPRAEQPFGRGNDSHSGDQVAAQIGRRVRVRFSLTSRITQRGAGIGCGRSGQPRPPTSRRTKPQPAGPAVTLPGPGRLTGAGPLDDPGPAADVPGRPGARARAQVRDLTRIQVKDVDAIAASRPGSPPPASCAVTRDQLHRQGAMDRCGMHDGHSTGATAIRKDPVGGMRARPGAWIRDLPVFCPRFT